VELNVDGEVGLRHGARWCDRLTAIGQLVGEVTSHKTPPLEHPSWRLTSSVEWPQ
jgi:hypothetical protein